MSTTRKILGALMTDDIQHNMFMSGWVGRVKPRIKRPFPRLTISKFKNTNGALYFALYSSLNNECH